MSCQVKRWSFVGVAFLFNSSFLSRSSLISMQWPTTYYCIGDNDEYCTGCAYKNAYTHACTWRFTLFTFPLWGPRLKSTIQPEQFESWGSNRAANTPPHELEIDRRRPWSLAGHIGLFLLWSIFILHRDAREQFVMNTPLWSCGMSDKNGLAYHSSPSPSTTAIAN